MLVVLILIDIAPKDLMKMIWLLTVAMLHMTLPYKASVRNIISKTLVPSRELRRIVAENEI